jgi:predicted XRE-type DNA-binding protein
VKIRSVRHNNRKKAFEVKTSTATYEIPYSKVARAGAADRMARVFVDPDLAREGFTYVLDSGHKGTVHMDQVLEYNRDPNYLRDALLYRLTVEAQRRIKSSTLSKREIIRRLGTSAPQLYRLLDQTNYRKSVDRLLALLQVLDCEVTLTVRDRKASPRRVA